MVDNIITPPGLGFGTNGKILQRNSRIVMPSRITVRQVMASPPTLSYAGTNPLAAGRFWQSGQNNIAGSSFTYHRAGHWVSGLTYPNYNAVWARCVNYGSGGSSANSCAVSWIFTGTQFVISLLGYNESLLLKIDDQYVSLTPQVVANDGAGYYWSVTFGSAGRHRIELIAASPINAWFMGVYTASSDTIQPANIRGPRVIVVGDSFTEGSLATVGAASNYVQVFSDLMQWDDVWASGVGSTGYLAAPGGKLTYAQRIAGDVIAFNPDIVMVTGGYDDYGSGASATITAAASLYTTLAQSLPNALIVACAPFMSSGAGTTGIVYLQMRSGFKSAIQSVGGVFIDLIQQPLPSFVTPQVTTLSSPASANATSLATTAVLPPNITYQFADGTMFVTKTGGLSPTIDKCANAQSNGAIITQVGDCLWSGNGYVGATTGFGNCDVNVGSDHTHPTQSGHECIAEAIASQLMLALAPN